MKSADNKTIKMNGSKIKEIIELKKDDSGII